MDCPRQRKSSPTDACEQQANELLAVRALEQQGSGQANVTAYPTIAPGNPPQPRLHPDLDARPTTAYGQRFELPVVGRGTSFPAASGHRARPGPGSADGNREIVQRDESIVPTISLQPCAHGCGAESVVAATVPIVLPIAASRCSVTVSLICPAHFSTRLSAMAVSENFAARIWSSTASSFWIFIPR